MGGYHYKSNATLVIYTGAERRGEEGACCRSSQSNDSYLLLSGGYCGEDEFLSAKTIKKKSHRYRSCGILCPCEFIIVLGQSIGGNAMEFEMLADSIKQINDKASSAAKSAVNQLMTLRNWAIGYYIVEYEQDGSDRAELFWSSNKKSHAFSMAQFQCR